MGCCISAWGAFWLPQLPRFVLCSIPSNPLWSAKQWSLRCSNGFFFPALCSCHYSCLTLFNHSEKSPYWLSARLKQKKKGLTGWVLEFGLARVFSLAEVILRVWLYFRETAISTDKMELNRKKEVARSSPSHVSFTPSSEAACSNVWLLPHMFSPVSFLHVRREASCFSSRCVPSLNGRKKLQQSAVSQPSVSGITRLPFLRGLRSCDSTLLFCVWPLDYCLRVSHAQLKCARIK